MARAAASTARHWRRRPRAIAALPTKEPPTDAPASTAAQKEPVLTTASSARVLFNIAAGTSGLTDEDLAILGPVMRIVAGVVIRAGVFDSAMVKRLLDDDEPVGA